MSLLCSREANYGEVPELCGYINGKAYAIVCRDYPGQPLPAGSPFVICTGSRHLLNAIEDPCTCECHVVKVENGIYQT